MRIKLSRITPMQAGVNQRLLPLFFGGQLFNCRLNFCHRAHRGKLADCRPTGKDADHPARLFHRFPLASG